MTDIQEQKLLDIAGKAVKHEGKIYDVKNFKENERNLIIFTKQRSFVFQPSQLDAWLETIEIVENSSKAFLPATKPESKSDKVNLQIYEPTESQKAVQNSLLDMLEKVKADPKAIPQAKAICDIANTMVNMEKAQIQLMNLAKNI